MICPFFMYIHRVAENHKVEIWTSVFQISIKKPGNLMLQFLFQITCETTPGKVRRIYTPLINNTRNMNDFLKKGP